jgi:hypothetical protein
MNKLGRPKITIRGRVTLDGAPMADATVRLLGTRSVMARLRRASSIDPEGSSYVISVLSDQQGSFRFRDVPAGAYTLEASAPSASLFNTSFSTATSITVDIPLIGAPDVPAVAAAAGPVRKLECGINIDPANPVGNPSAAALRELGATWVRLVFQNHPGQPLSESFTQYDRVVSDMRQAGVSVLMILNNQSFPGKPPREALDDPVKWRAYTVGFAQRCQEVAVHYRDAVPAYQIWNEPDHDGVLPEYDPTVRAGLYGEMLRAAFNAIRPVSESLIVTAGMASGNPGYVRSAMAATGNMLFADVLAVHPYGRRPRFQWPNATWGGLGGLEMIEFLKGYRAIVRKPIWVTEYGTEDRQTLVVGPGGASILAGDLFPGTTFESVGNNLFGVVTKFFWFCWSDGMRAGMGLVELNGNRKGAFNSFQSYAVRPLAG